MPATTFMVPVLSGRTDAWQSAVGEMRGPRKAEYEESRRRMGIRREVVSLQSMPQGDFVAVYLDGTDPSGVVAKYLPSDVPFDRWFTDTVLKGVHVVTSAPPPNETLLGFLAWCTRRAPRRADWRGGQLSVRHGNAKTNSVLPVLGRSSGVRPMRPLWVSDTPVDTATYCLPSTA